MKTRLFFLGISSLICYSFASDATSVEKEWPNYNIEGTESLFSDSPLVTAQDTMTMTPSQEPAMKPYRQHFSVYGDFLYWKTYISDYAWTYAYDAKDNFSLFHHNFHSPSFNWDPGFRIGASFMSTWMDLFFDFSWTRFYTSKSQSLFNAALENSNILATGYFPFLADENAIFQNSLNGNPYYASASFQIHLNQFDFLMKKKFMVMNNRLSFLPFIGARLLYLSVKSNQQFIYNAADNTFTTTFPKNTYQFTTKNNNWGLGLVGGIKGMLDFGQGFSFYAGVDGALLGGTDAANRIAESIIPGFTPSVTTAILTRSKTTFHSVLDMESGFTWDKNFCDNRWGIGLKVAYEAHMYFDTPTFIYYDDVTQNLTTTFQGLTVGGSIRF